MRIIFETIDKYFFLKYITPATEQRHQVKQVHLFTFLYIAVLKNWTEV